MESDIQKQFGAADTYNSTLTNAKRAPMAIPEMANRSKMGEK